MVLRAHDDRREGKASCVAALALVQAVPTRDDATGVAAVAPLLLGGAALLALAAAAVLARRLARARAAARVLTRAAGEIARGQAGVRLPIAPGSRDLGALAGELNAAVQRLEDCIRGQACFARHVAHELRTPLAALQADAQVTQLAGAGAQELGPFLERTQRELRRLGQLVDDLLVLARIEAQEPRRDLVHLDDVVRAACERCLEAADSAGVRLEPQLESRGDPFVRGDGQLLQALVEHLLRDAIRRSPDGEAVTVARTRSEVDVTLVVGDHGPGLPDDPGMHVFERGGASVGWRSLEHGVGLGLAIARAVARVHGGRLALEHNGAGGCDVVVSVPAIPSADPAGRAPTVP